MYSTERVFTKLLQLKNLVLLEPTWWQAWHRVTCRLRAETGCTGINRLMPDFTISEFTVWAFYINGTIQHEILCVCFLSLSMMSSRFIHIVYMSVDVYTCRFNICIYCGKITINLNSHQHSYTFFVGLSTLSNF